MKNPSILDYKKLSNNASKNSPAPFLQLILFNSPYTLHPQIATDESSRFQPLYFFEGM